MFAVFFFSGIGVQGSLVAEQCQGTSGKGIRTMKGVEKLQGSEEAGETPSNTAPSNAWHLQRN